MANPILPGIEHIVVLMLENRSFDNVLGMLYPSSSAFNGIDPSFGNTYRQIFEHHTVYPNNPTGETAYTTPSTDPGESHHDMSRQIFGYDGGTSPNMSGFAQNYDDHTLKLGNPADVMAYFTPAQLPMTTFLAGFGVSDQWFASGPVQTFPNRMFAHCGTPGLSSIDSKDAARDDLDYLDDVTGSKLADVYGSVPNKSIFELLDGTNGPSEANWKVYFHDAPLSALNEYVYQAWQNGSPCVSSFDADDYDPPYGTTFFEDVVIDGKLPAYAFIEPRYFANYSNEGMLPNSNHPGASDYVQFLGSIGGPAIDVRQGEQLLFGIYTTLLLNYELFKKTLLIVVYDEHGGIFDHVSPGPATSPFDSKVHHGDTYDLFGVRVPAFFVNPAIPPGTIFRPPTGGPPFDHTTIISTLCSQFDLAGPLTARDQAAPTLAGLIPSAPAFRTSAELALPAAAKQFCEAISSRAAARPGARKSMERHQAMLSERVRAKGRR